MLNELYLAKRDGEIYTHTKKETQFQKKANMAD